MPIVDGMHGQAAFGPCFGGTTLVFANTEPGIVRSKHEANCIGNSGIGQSRNAIFNKRCGVLLSEHDGPRARHPRFKRGFKCGALCFGETRKRRDAADGVVARDEIRELLRFRCAAASNMCVVRLDIGRRAWRSVGHHYESVVLCSVHCVTPSQRPSV